MARSTTAVMIHVRGRSARRLTKRHAALVLGLVATTMMMSAYGGWLAFHWLRW